MVLYKLSRRVGQEGEETRRLSIPGPPLAWYELSQQLSSLFNIPVNQVAVRYKDEEGDMITLSSETELEDYYASLQIQSSDTVKFVVFNLSSSRVPSMAADSTRAPSRASDFDPTEANRDTFGAAPDHPLAFDLDGPWERILAPGADLHMPFGLAKTDSDRFEELSTTTMSSVVKPVDLDALSNHSDSSGTTVPPPSQNKGKARASSFVGLEATNNQYGLWSTNSLLASQAPPKQTVHILNVADDDEPDFGLHNSSTPKVNVGNLRPVESLGSLPEAEPLLPTQEVPDPPEADIHSHNAVPPAPAPSFANDLSQFLNSFSAAVASHPELSEGLRNLVQNTTSGAYWAAHQAAMSDMASRLSSRTADEMQRAEQDAYRRTTEILGTLFRTLAAGVTNNPEASQNEGENADPPPAETGTAREPVDGPPVPPPPPGNWGHWFPGRHSMPPWRAFHPGPPDSMFGPPPFPPHPPMGGHPWPHPPPRSRGGPPPPVPPPPGDRTRPTPAELRAQVEAAKLLYKAEKERYRAEREQRRQEKERRVQIDQAIGKGEPNNVPAAAGPSAPGITANVAPVVEEVVQAARPRGHFPALEVVNVQQPRRSHTIGHAPSRSINRRQTPGPERIIRRLADMGFSEKAYPSLSSQVQSQIGEETTLSKDREDDIVTSLVEDLLVASPRPEASGSRSVIPGAWT